MILGLLAPTPLIFVYLRQGKQIGLISLGIVFFIILILMGSKQALIFGAEYGTLAVIMGEAIRRSFPIERAVVFSALGSAVFSGVILFLVLAEGELSVSRVFEQEMEAFLDQSIQTMKEMGKDQAEIDSAYEFMKKIYQSVAVSFPAILAVGSLICATVNYCLVSLVWNRLTPTGSYGFGKLSQWTVPDQLIWVLIACAGLLVLPENGLGLIGLNGLIFVLAIYFFQGLGVLFFFLEKRNVSIFLWPLALVLVFVQPLFMGVLNGLGIFDLWIDFRKLKPREPVNPGNDFEE